MTQLNQKHDSIHAKIQDLFTNWFKDMDAYRLGTTIGATLAILGFILMVPGFARLVGWGFTLAGGLLAGSCLVVLLERE